MKKLMINGCARASLALAFAGAAAFAGAEDVTMSRDLQWTYSGTEAFETPANWTWSTTSSDPIETCPGAVDTVRFKGAPASGSDMTVTMNADAVVSNFIYEAGAKKGTIVNLSSHTLTVSNNLSVSSYLGQSALTFKDGRILLPGSQTGTKSTYGQLNEDASGFFMNRMAADAYGGINLVFDNASLVATNSPYETTLQAKSLSGCADRIQLLNGASWTLKNFKLKNTTEDAPVDFVASGEGTSLTVAESLTFDHKTRISFTFKDGAELHAGRLYSTYAYNAASNSIVTLNGGTHTLANINASYETGACLLTKTDLVVMNKAALTAEGQVQIRSSSSITVCEGGTFTTPGIMSIGRQDWDNQKANFHGNSSLVVDDGRVSAGRLMFGSRAENSNNCLRVVGSLSRVEQNDAKLYGQQTGVALNYGTKVAFEIPSMGYCDADGAARAPVYSAGDFRSETADGCRPISLELTTKAFDKANPKKAITLMQAGANSTTVFEALIANATWVDNPLNHGELSVSEDGLSLVYTAPTPKGLLLIVR